MALVGVSMHAVLSLFALGRPTAIKWLFDLVMDVLCIAAVWAELTQFKWSIPVGLLICATAARVFESLRTLLAASFWTPESQPGRRVFAAFVFMVHMSTAVMMLPLVAFVWETQVNATLEQVPRYIPMPWIFAVGAVWALQLLHGLNLAREVLSSRTRSAASSAKKSQ